MITELILSTIILSNPLRITQHLKPLEHTEQYIHTSPSHFVENSSDISLMSYYEITCVERTLVGYENILSYDVLNKHDNLVTRVNVYIYDKYSSDFNIRDGELFFADLKMLLDQFDISGIPIPALLAQAYTEGGAGKAGVYRQSNNLFGLRAGPAWDGYVYARDKKRTYDSYETARAHRANDLFRAYNNVEDSLEDYIDLVQTSSRYRSALGKSSKRYLKELTKHGYGDPEMVSTWMSLIKLYKLDK